MSEFHGPLKDGYLIATELSRMLTIGTLVSFDLKTGEMVFHEGYTPSAAAKQFWDAMHLELKRRL